MEAKVNYEIDLIVSMTDNAPLQYKNRKAFLFTSEYPKRMIHMFLGSRHGKFWSDQASRWFSNFLHRAIASERVHVKSARDIAEFAEKEYATPDLGPGICQHFQVSINFVNNIPYSAMSDSITVDETCLIHAVRNVGKSGVIEKWGIGCLCPGCISGDRPCKYPEYFRPWVKECVSKRVSMDFLSSDDEEEFVEDGWYLLNDSQCEAHLEADSVSLVARVT